MSRDNSLKALFLSLSVAGAPLTLLMALAPQSSVTKRLAAGNLLLKFYSGIYTVLFLRATIRNPGLFRAAVTLDVSKLLAYTGERGFAISVWAHASTCDAFLARWIYVDSMRRGRVARVPILLQYALGPIGLFAYLMREKGGDVLRPPSLAQEDE